MSEINKGENFSNNIENNESKNISVLDYFASIENNDGEKLDLEEFNDFLSELDPVEKQKVLDLFESQKNNLDLINYLKDPDNFFPIDMEEFDVFKIKFGTNLNKGSKNIGKESDGNKINNLLKNFKEEVKLEEEVEIEEKLSEENSKRKKLLESIVGNPIFNKLISELTNRKLINLTTDKGVEYFTEIIENNFELLGTIDVPFVIKETNRKYQHTVSQMSIWKKR